MATNNIDIKIGSSFNGAGFDKLNRSLQHAGGNVKKASAAFGNVIGQLDVLDGSLGKVVGAWGGLVDNVMKLGVWGLVTAAIGVLVSKLSELRKVTEETRKAHEAFRDSMEHGWERTAELGRRRRAKEDAKKQAELEARERAKAEEAEQRKRANDETNRSEGSWNAMLARRDALAVKEFALSQTEGDEVQNAQNEAAVARKVAENAVTNAKRELERAQRHFTAGSFQVMAAEDALKDAELNLAKVVKDNEAAIKKATEAKNKELEETAKAAEAAKKEAVAKEKRSQQEKLRADSEKAVSELDKKLAAVRERAAALEEQAAKARGKSFGEWSRDQRQDARLQAREAYKQSRRVASVMGEIALLEDEQRRNGKGFNPQRAARLAKLREWLADQDPKNNPALKQAELLEKQKMDLIAKTQRDIADIAKELKDATT